MQRNHLGLPPVVKSYKSVYGHTVNICYPGTWEELCAAWGRELSAAAANYSLPLNTTAKQVCNVPEPEVVHAG